MTHDRLPTATRPSLGRARPRDAGRTNISSGGNLTCGRLIRRARMSQLARVVDRNRRRHDEQVLITQTAFLFALALKYCQVVEETKNPKTVALSTNQHFACVGFLQLDDFVIESLRRPG